MSLVSYLSRHAVPNPPDLKEMQAKAWKTKHVLVVDMENTVLTWADREVLERVGNKLYGPAWYRPKAQD